MFCKLIHLVYNLLNLSNSTNSLSDSMTCQKIYAPLHTTNTTDHFRCTASYRYSVEHINSKIISIKMNHWLILKVSVPGFLGSTNTRLPPWTEKCPKEVYANGTEADRSVSLFWQVLSPLCLSKHEQHHPPFPLSAWTLWSCAYWAEAPSVSFL